MELSAAALADTQEAFDGVAAGYDQTNTANPIIGKMRERTIALIQDCLPPGSALLDLGCGPGADAAELGRRGYRVTAVDSSGAMARQAQHRIVRAGLDALVRVRSIGIQQLDELEPGVFDGAYSDFGPLNCVPGLSGVASALASRLRPGGVLVASVIGRICPWEIARYGLTGNWRRMRARFAPGFVPVPLEGRTIWTRYYAPSEFQRPFSAAGFRTVSLSALGLFLPPPYLQGFYGRHPVWMRGLDWLERRTAHWPGLRDMGDHFLIAMERR